MQDYVLGSNVMLCLSTRSETPFMTRDKARALIREFMQDTGDDAAMIAHLLHPS